MIDYEYNGEIYKIIPLEKMQIGTYFGRCRNAKYAYWAGNCFIYVRCKFGDEFLERIEHPENEYRYDVFLPFQIIEEETEETLKLLELINKEIKEKRTL